MQKIDKFHNHLDECEQCRERPFGLCDVGHVLLTKQDICSQQPEPKVYLLPDTTSLEVVDVVALEMGCSFVRVSRDNVVEQVHFSDHHARNDRLIVVIDEIELATASESVLSPDETVSLEGVPDVYYPMSWLIASSNFRTCDYEKLIASGTCSTFK
jgi:hypothetical protein